jgi:hypothetical protein
MNKRLDPLVQSIPPATATINVTKEGHHHFQTKNTALKTVPANIPEIVLAKISAVRYIAFGLLMRYFDGPVTVTTS